MAYMYYDGKDWRYTNSDPHDVSHFVVPAAPEKHQLCPHCGQDLPRCKECGRALPLPQKPSYPGNHPCTSAPPAECVGDNRTYMSPSGISVGTEPPMPVGTTGGE